VDALGREQRTQLLDPGRFGRNLHLLVDRCKGGPGSAGVSLTAAPWTSFRNAAISSSNARKRSSSSARVTATAFLPSKKSNSLKAADQKAARPASSARTRARGTSSVRLVVPQDQFLPAPQDFGAITLYHESNPRPHTQGQPGARMRSGDVLRKMAENGENGGALRESHEINGVRRPGLCCLWMS
jgi:hypothetical protein